MSSAEEWFEARLIRGLMQEELGSVIFWLIEAMLAIVRDAQVAAIAAQHA